MSSNEWRWPINSTDPGINVVIIVLLSVLTIAAIALGAMIAVPVLIVLGLTKAVHYLANQPVPTHQLTSAARQKAIQADFPDPDKFVEAHLNRFIASCGDELPAAPLYRTMAGLVH